MAESRAGLTSARCIYMAETQAHMSARMQSHGIAVFEAQAEYYGELWDTDAPFKYHVRSPYITSIRSHAAHLP